MVENKYGDRYYFFPRQTLLSHTTPDTFLHPFQHAWTCFFTSCQFQFYLKEHSVSFRNLWPAFGVFPSQHVHMGPMWIKSGLHVLCVSVMCLLWEAMCDKMIGPMRDTSGLNGHGLKEGPIVWVPHTFINSCHILEMNQINYLISEYISLRVHMGKHRWGHHGTCWQTSLRTHASATCSSDGTHL